MKIGILTFHYGSNYGGVLQCYALQQVLKKSGHDVQVINYVPHQPIKNFLIVCRSCYQQGLFKGIKSFFLYLRYSYGCRKVFMEFSDKFLQKSNSVHDINGLKSLDYDAVVVGSDQVWNKSQQSSPVYFLGWVGPKSKKISYAACCGQNIIREEFRKKLTDELNRFDKISVRSNETSDFVRRLTGRTPQVVCDPTMLYQFDEFKSKSSNHYIFAYILGDENPGGNDYVIQEIRKKYPKHKVCAVQIGDRCMASCAWADKVLYNVSPIEWVSYIYNSSFVYTDSYHGSVFAMKFKKPLLAYYTSPVSGMRFKDLGNSFSMHNIIVNAKEAVAVLNENMELGYNYDQNIDAYIQESLNFIKSI